MEQQRSLVERSKMRGLLTFHGPFVSRTGFQPVCGASSPSSFHGQDTRGDRLEACPTRSLGFMRAEESAEAEDALLHGEFEDSAEHYERSHQAPRLRGGDAKG